MDANGNPIPNIPPRACRRCKSVKPLKAHHCRTCGRCIIRMDHHCPWVNNCVAIFNQKYFLLFLLYTCILCIYSGVVLVLRFISCTNNLKQCSISTFQAVLCVLHFVEALVFGLFVSIMMFDQLTAIFENTPGIDALQKKQGVKRGKYESLKDVFAEPFHWKWFLPLNMPQKIYEDFAAELLQDTEPVSDSHEEQPGYTSSMQPSSTPMGYDPSIFYNNNHLSNNNMAPQPLTSHTKSPHDLFDPSSFQEEDEEEVEEEPDWEHHEQSVGMSSEDGEDSQISPQAGSRRASRPFIPQANHEHVLTHVNANNNNNHSGNANSGNVHTSNSANNGHHHGNSTSSHSTGHQSPQSSSLQSSSDSARNAAASARNAALLAQQRTLAIQQQFSHAHNQ